MRLLVQMWRLGWAAGWAAGYARGYLDGARYRAKKEGGSHE